MRYIQQETVEWLGGEDNPILRYLAIREFPDYFVSTALSAYSAMRDSVIVSRIAQGEIPGDTERYDLIHKGTVWALAEMVTCGMTIDDLPVSRAVDFILKSVQMSSGGCTMNWVPPAPAAGWSGDILYYLLRAGYQGKEIHRAAEWILSRQRFDGGWLHSPLGSFGDLLGLLFLRRSGKGMAHEEDRKRESCMVSTISCGRALTLYRDRFNACHDSVARAGDFVLSKRRLARKRNPQNEGYNVSMNFHKIGYPVLCRQDMLSGLLFLAEAGMIGDERAVPSFNSLMKRRRDDGSFACESTALGTLQGKYRMSATDRDKWTTLQALRLMKYLELRN